VARVALILRLELVSPDDVGRLREPLTSVCIAIAVRLYLFNIAANKYPLNFSLRAFFFDL
jgi:hypothetical protein